MSSGKKTDFLQKNTHHQLQQLLKPQLRDPDPRWTWLAGGR